MKESILKLSRLFLAYLKGDIQTLESQKLSPLEILIVPGFIGFGRHALEIMGGGYGMVRWSDASVINTISYAYFVAYAPIMIAMMWYRPSLKKIEFLFRVALPFTFMIHLIAPLGNTLFNYHGPHWPQVYRWEWLPTHLYFPMGTVLGFVYAVFVGRVWLGRIFGGEAWRSWLAVCLMGFFILIYCYQLAVAFAFGPHLKIFYPDRIMMGFADADQRTHFYNAWLVLPVAVSYWVFSRFQRVLVLGVLIFGCVSLASLWAAYK
jgi:hypothetical protein